DRAQADRGSRYVRPRHEVRAHSAGVVARADARSRAVSEELHGTRAIREAQLEAFDNRTPERDYTVQFTIPEFTCLCPISGFPDFATLHGRYVPGPRCVELKSLKLYINGFRDRNVYHEDVVNVILSDLVTLLAPRFCEVIGDFNVRGNIKTVV